MSISGAAVPPDPVIPERVMVVEPFADPRGSDDTLAGERAGLFAWLDSYRVALRLKIAGLDADQLVLRSAPPSELSLLGLVRHLAEVEDYWLREVLLGVDVPPRWSRPDSPDADFTEGTAETAAQDVAAYEDAVLQARQAVAEWTDLDRPVLGLRHGAPVNLRWILIHLIEEYARHLGHMDLLRERIDGAVGY